MTSRPPAPCHHELRPGTKVCLHCRRAEREATAARHRKILLRMGLLAAAIGGCVYAGFSGVDAWQKRSALALSRLIASPAALEAAPVPAPAAPTPQTPAPTDTSSDSSATVLAASAGSGMAQPLATPELLTVAAPAGLAPALPTVSAPVTTLEPSVAEGRTDLGDGIYALRTGDTVTVHFDTPGARTRRPEKFEQVVRATLPQVHGATADSILSGIATGNLVGAGELAAEQPNHAIRLRAPGGLSLSLWPQTRPGRDGPLVVAYRVTPAH